MKKRKFSIHRHVTHTRDAQRRWDRAYQYLVQWSAASSRDTSQEERSQENLDESRDVCARLYAAAGASADH